MDYQDSYIWKLRQKVGQMTIITTSVFVVPIRADGRIKLTLKSDFGCWVIPSGYVELTDSWGDAAVRELEEEVGIVTDKENLELFATISGSNLILHYDDGNTRPFGNAYIVRQWSKEHTPNDLEESAQTKWVSLDEARQMNTHYSTQLLINAYEKYLKTGKIQAIEEEK
ncbi:NUDIX domain-containing protein [Candidatus Saccharibacteria bacterium]|nr:NUDIX domain-containing protein [Candidatus Saccharibacteria bacterium]